MKLTIETIKHEDQREGWIGVGDWEVDGDEIIVSVSNLGDWRMEMLVGLHEAVEAVLCLHDGISQRAVDDFDMRYEAKRPAGDDSEPGDALAAPYGQAHCYATALERMLCAAMNIPWAVYTERVLALPSSKGAGA